VTANLAVQPRLTERHSWTGVGRAAAFGGAGVLAAINSLADKIIVAFGHAPMIGVVANLAGISAVIWFAMYAALKIGWDAEADQLRRSDWPVLIMVLVLAILPVSYAAKAGLLLCGFYGVATSRPGEPTRRIALVLLALTGTFVWGPLILTIFSGPLLALDAHIVGRAIGSTVNGNLVQFTHSQDSFLIAAGCSSVHNISLAIVLWCTAVALFNLRVDARLVATGVAMIFFMFALNAARLCAIGLYPDHFESLHTGAGGALFGWAGLIGTVAIAGLGTHDALNRRS
jgi:hypothetical protein